MPYIVTGRHTIRRQEFSLSFVSHEEFYDVIHYETRAEAETRLNTLEVVAACINNPPFPLPDARRELMAAVNLSEEIRSLTALRVANVAISYTEIDAT